MSDARNEVLLSVGNVAYPDGNVGACYVLAHDHGNGDITGCAVSIRRARELQNEGVPFDGAHVIVEAFTTFFGPDFPMVGEPRTALAETRQRMGIRTCEPYVMPGTCEEWPSC